MSIADAPARTGANLALALTGQAITYVRVGTPTKDLTTGVATPSKVNHTLKGLETKIHHSLVDGTKIQMSDRMVLIDAVAFQAAIGAGTIPSSDDQIIVDGRLLAVIDHFPVKSGEQYALFKVVVRR